MLKIILRPVVFALGMIAMLCSCSNDPLKPGLEFMPDMYRSSAYGTYEASKIFADSVSALKPVAGTIPRGYDTYFPYANDTTGYETAGRALKNPLEMSAENIAEGKRLYNIFCINCHGEKGDGNGTLRIKGDKFPGVPNYATAKSSRGGDMKNMPDGKIFHTITYGLNLMGSHASQINPTERWKIVMYVHELQKGGTAAVADSSATKDSTAKM
ncbi:MAG TPA: cytochrome c [Bacteroidia bacterium]|nr:cytochrome c [Bacteroidia bacterium]